MNPTCPIDDKDDSIQKVSAILISGQTSGTFEGSTRGVVESDGTRGTYSGRTSINVASTSNLARLLTPPPELQKPGLGTFWIAVVIAVPFIFISVMANQDRPEGACFLSLIFMGAVALNYFFSKRQKDKADLVYAQEKPAWDAAMKKWSRLYYCHKHDIIFDPETGESSAPSNLKEFIYKT